MTYSSRAINVGKINETRTVRMKSHVMSESLLTGKHNQLSLTQCKHLQACMDDALVVVLYCCIRFHDFPLCPIISCFLSATYNTKTAKFLFWMQKKTWAAHTLTHNNILGTLYCIFHICVMRKATAISVVFYTLLTQAICR